MIKERNDRYDSAYTFGDYRSITADCGSRCPSGRRHDVYSGIRRFDRLRSIYRIDRESLGQTKTEVSPHGLLLLTFRNRFAKNTWGLMRRRQLAIVEGKSSPRLFLLLFHYRRDEDKWRNY